MADQEFFIDFTDKGTIATIQKRMNELANSGGQVNQKLVTQLNALAKSAKAAGDASEAANKSAIAGSKAAEQAIKTETAAINQQTAALKLETAQRKQAEAAAKSQGATIDGVAASLRRYAQLAAVAFAGNFIVKASDEFTRIANTVQAFTKSQAEANTTFKALTQIALDTYQPLSNVAELYGVIAVGAGRLKLTQEQVVAAVGDVSKALFAVGASAEGSGRIINQFTQILSKPKAQIQDLRIISENSPAFIGILVSGLQKIGVSSGAASAGIQALAGVSGKDLLRGLEAVRGEITAMAAERVPTLSNAVTNLQTQFVLLVGGVQNTTGVFSLLAQAVIFLSQHLEAVTIALAAFALVFITYKLVSTIFSVVGAVRDFGIANILLTVQIAGVVIAVGALALVFAELAHALGLIDDPLVTISKGFEALKAKYNSLTDQTKFQAASQRALGDSMTGTGSAASAATGGLDRMGNGLDNLTTDLNQTTSAANKTSSALAKVIQSQNIAYNGGSGGGGTNSSIFGGSGTSGSLGSGSTFSSSGSGSNTNNTNSIQQLSGSSGGITAINRNGGGGIVPGAGAVDSKLVQFVASPGERVIIQTREQQNAGKIPHFRDGGSINLRGLSGINVSSKEAGSSVTGYESGTSAGDIAKGIVNGLTIYQQGNPPIWGRGIDAGSYLRGDPASRFNIGNQGQAGALSSGKSIIDLYRSATVGAITAGPIGWVDPEALAAAKDIADNRNSTIKEIKEHLADIQARQDKATAYQIRNNYKRKEQIHLSEEDIKWVDEAKKYGLLSGSAFSDRRLQNTGFSVARDGLDYVVPGGGGVDSRTMGLQVSPGERVTVQTRAQQDQANRLAQASGGGRQVVINFQVNATDIDSFKRSEPQLLRDFVEKAGKAIEGS